MLSIRFVHLALLISAAFWPVGLAAQEKLVIDPTHSEVHFTLGDVLHTVHGMFGIQQGEITFNPSTGEASGNIAVDAESGRSGNSMRDKRMTNDELKAESYRSITFAPTRFTGTFNPAGDSTLQVHGVFTLLGTAHEIDVPMQLQVNGTQLRGTGSFVVPFVKWGLKDPSTLMLKVNKEVQIQLLVIGTLQR
jgi:polyisoprenoid-binding protein YceI